MPYYAETRQRRHKKLSNMKKYSLEARELLSNAELYELKAGDGGGEPVGPGGPIPKCHFCAECIACASECTACTNKVAG